jgi:hypothetical protein
MLSTAPHTAMGTIGSEFMSMVLRLLPSMAGRHIKVSARAVMVVVLTGWQLT